MLCYVWECFITLWTRCDGQNMIVARLKLGTNLHVLTNFFPTQPPPPPPFPHPPPLHPTPFPDIADNNSFLILNFGWREIGCTADRNVLRTSSAETRIAQLERDEFVLSYCGCGEANAET